MRRWKQFVLAALVLCMVCVTPVYAANTTDENFNFTVTSKPSVVQARSKTDDTKVYVYYDVGASKTCFQTWGSNSLSTSGGANCTRGTTATVQKDVKSSITNYIYEQSYSYAFLKVMAYSEATSDTYTAGRWSPDSTKNYTVVNGSDHLEVE